MTDSTSVLEDRVRGNGKSRNEESRRLLIIAWGYPGASSQHGTALARRVGQLARGFARRGWYVDVLHRATTATHASQDADDGVRLHSIPEPRQDALEGHSALLRRLTTAWYATFHGDRSARWARVAQSRLSLFDAAPPSVVIGSFTPRGTLSVAREASRRWHVPWIADLQDPALEGSGGAVRPLAEAWSRRTLRSANAVVQVSPEWAAADAKLLGREVVTLRHAVPVVLQSDHPRATDNAGPLKLLYAGSLLTGHQSPEPLLRAVERLNRGQGRPIQLSIAGSEATQEEFASRLADDDSSDWFRPLGWLGADALAREISESDVLVLIPSSDRTRPVVPSKLYEYMAYDRPVLIAGPDSGALANLFAEWGHPDVTCTTPESIADALHRARHGDFTTSLRRSACRNAPMNEDQLVDRYLDVVSNVLSTHS